MTGQRLQERCAPGRKVNVLENRKTRRFKVQWAVEVIGTDHRGERFAEPGELENLSSTGAYLYMPRALEVGARLDVRIQIPFKNENWMKYAAEVVRVEIASPVVGIALKFENARPVFERK